jgi:hypothetical protein
MKTDGIESMLNLGTTSGAWLRAIGIRTREQLEEVGVEEAYARVLAHGFNASANLLYALEGAITDTHWTRVPDGRKAELRAYAARARSATTRGIE